MANALASIFVELLVNHGQFLSGFAEAGLASKKFRNEFENAFSNLGSVASTALAPLGEFGAVVGQTLSQIGTYGALASRAMSGLGGSLGGLAAVGGLAAGGIAAVAAGSLSLAAHTAESIARLGELSQSTGVSVGALSSLGFAGKAVGIDVDTMAKGLEKMDKAVFKAATSTLGSVNAFTRLHIAVRDSSGAIRPAVDIFGDLAEKFAAMPDSVAKTNFALEIFGRGGAVMVPLLNKGKEGLQGFLDTAKALGIVLDESTAAAAEKFKEDVVTLEAAGEGLAIRLTKDLLPALDFLADKLVTSFKTGQAQELIDKIAELVKNVLVLGYELAHIGDLKFMGNTSAALHELQGALDESAVATHRSLFAGGLFANRDDPARLAAEKKDTEEIAKIRAETAKNVNAALGGISFEQFNKNSAAFRAGLEGTLPFPTKFGDFDFTHLPGKGGAFGADDAAKKEKDIIGETIGKLRAQTDEYAALANAISDVTANTILATAAAEGEKTIAETNTKAKRQNRQLTEGEKDSIRELTTLKAAYNAGFTDNKAAADFIQKTQLQTSSLNLLAEAFKTETPLAIEQAEEAAKVAPFAKDITDIQEVIAQLQKLGATGAQLAPLFSSLTQLESKVATAKGAVHHLFFAEESKALGEATRAIDFQTDAAAKLTPALLGGAAALRQFNIEQAITAFHEKNPLVDTTSLRQSLTRGEDVKLTQKAATSVAESQPFLASLEQLHGLELLEAEEAKYGRDTEAIETLLFQTKIKYAQDYSAFVFAERNKELLGMAQLFDQEIRLAQVWDDAAFKVGNFGLKLKAVFNELVIQGKNAGQAIANAWLTAIDGIETQFAKFLTGQKTNFKDVFQQLGESIVKAQIQKGVGAIAEHFGIDIGKPDGTSGKPFHVVMARAAGLAGAAEEAAGGTKGGWFGKVLGAVFGKGSGGAGAVEGLGAPDGSASNPFYVIDAVSASQTGLGKGIFDMFGGGGGESSSGGEGGGGFFSSIFSALGAAFGGGGAEGIDMMPGKWYVTGEKGKELIGPKNQGDTVYPMSKLGGQQRPIVQNNTFNFPRESDMFRRSASQIVQAFHRQSSIAMSRS